MSITQELTRVALVAGKDEYTDYLVYKHLAEKVKKPKLASVLSNLSETEFRHYQYWKKYCGGEEIRPNGWTVRIILLLQLFLGTTFAVKFLEKHEGKVIAKYRSVSKFIPEEDRASFEAMLADEEDHENGLAKQLEGSFVRYISFIILGLADAIVEISGIHAGSLGIYKSTELTGLAGIVAGAAASLAMASAAYAQAKQGFAGKASVSAVSTGVSYFVNAVILASPYFLTKNMGTAIGLSIALAIIIIGLTSYYNSVISNSRFLRDFGELAGITLGASGALYVFGLFIASVFHIVI